MELGDRDIVVIGAPGAQAGPAPAAGLRDAARPMPGVPAELFGQRSRRLSAAAAAGLPVPAGLALSPQAAVRIADGAPLGELLDALGLGESGLLALRPGEPGAGALAPAILNLGLTEAKRAAIAARHGARMAADLDRRFTAAFAVHVLGLPAEPFERALSGALKGAGAEGPADLDTAALEALGAASRDLVREAGCEVPDSPEAQIRAAVAARLSAAASPRTAKRRRARGLSETAPQAMILQAMALGLAPGRSGTARASARCATTGGPKLTGRFLAQSQGEEALSGLRAARVLTAADRASLGLPSPALEETDPDLAAAIAALAAGAETSLGDAYELHLAVEQGRLSLLDLEPLRRSSRAALRIAVGLAEAGAVSRAAALSRIAPAAIDDHLHPTILPGAAAPLIGRGLAASPGAAAGALVFTPDAAEAAAAAGNPAVLALTETGPEDIRGMHAAAAVLTVRGGMTSHAALVARGLGRPCVVGARELRLDPGARRLTARDGRSFGEGDAVTVDGTEGAVLEGRVATRPPEITGAFATLMSWADSHRRLGLRANADTAADAAIARGFGAAGIGLCRTEHMFFQERRIAAMREMILAETPEARRTALARLKPMQVGDFTQLFREMSGSPVVIRLLDPPLHEFLPHDAAEIAEVAELLGLPVDRVLARARDLAEFNPMLGKRGCRIGIAYPEIYEMQAGAIYEAAAVVEAETGRPVRPEIMVPLVSAVRELEVIRALVDAEAARAGVAETTVGVMIETPRACLRAGDIARIADFLSFGTNDLTQMLYGLSRDDAGRFMPDYVGRGVFAHDPFHRIDEEGVGEIIRIAIARARDRRPAISIGLCGEHGGEPSSIDFCERAGFDYVSCSPYRVPVARLAAAQARIGDQG